MSVDTLSELFGTQMHRQRTHAELHALAARFPSEVRVYAETPGRGVAKWRSADYKFNITGVDTDSGPQWCGWIADAVGGTHRWDSIDYYSIDRLLYDMIKAFKEIK